MEWATLAAALLNLAASAMALLGAAKKPRG